MRLRHVAVGCAVLMFVFELESKRAGLEREREGYRERSRSVFFYGVVTDC